MKEAGHGSQSRLLSTVLSGRQNMVDCRENYPARSLTTHEKSGLFVVKTSINMDKRKVN